ncbi:putative peroxisomal membrane protein PMP34 [Apostichopus japonicus]|uniref:Putative peroxisomal membrane protein PMP34 n=1 Tax=Stichopus japonicus TaxID=307972 RepID=A0A2G8KPA8_STIJA|nr:putative peroxisomal membrane protein PMP34 [Apostichopus japonicus]
MRYWINYSVFAFAVDDKRQAQHTPVVIAEILSEEGLSSLYRGWRPVITSLWLSNFVYFYTFNGLKLFLVDSMRTRKALKDLLMGISAGIVNVLSTTPMWVVNTRLKMQGVHFKTERIEKKKFPKYSGIIDAFQKIISQEGVSTLWSGTVSSLALVINPALHFMIYESLKRYYSRLTKGATPSALHFFIIGAIAKTLSTTATYPLQVIQSKLRYGRDNTEDGEKKPTMLDIFNIYYISGSLSEKSIVVKRLRQWTCDRRTQGRNGFYKGLETKLVQTVLTAALMFVCYEKIAAFIFRILGANLTTVKT